MQNPDKNQHPCANCSFYSKSVWQPVSGCLLSLLSGSFRRKNLTAGERLFDQGSKSRGVYCVSKGLIALRTYHTDGTSTLMRLAYPGEIIGFRAFHGNGVHQTEAHALLASRICTVSQRGAHQVIQANSSVLARLASRCLEEIDRNHKRIISSATKSNKQRLAEVLLRLMDAHGELEGKYRRMHLPLSRLDLADLIGVQPETMSRLVGRLERDGYFSIVGREVIVQI